MITLRRILLNTIVGLALFSIGYFGIRYLIKKERSPSIVKYTEQGVQKNIIVDSLLIVVDSLTVQVDSLHREGNKVNLVFVPQKVDTALILAQYYRTYNYTLKHKDKNLDLKLNFDLHQNKIHTPKLEYKILKPTTVFKPLKQNKKHLFFGATLGGSEFELDQFTPELIFFTEKHGFKIGYNLLDHNRNIQIGYYFKIR